MHIKKYTFSISSNLLYHFRSGHPSTLIPSSSSGNIDLTFAFNIHPQILQMPLLLCSHLLHISSLSFDNIDDLPVIRLNSQTL